MGSLIDAIRSLKPWQTGVLVAVFAGAIGAVYGVYALVGSSGQEGLGEGQQEMLVQYGDLVNQVSVNGSLVFPERETLTFGAQGRIDEVLVKEGQLVEEGQPLARLDEPSVSNLETAVARARVDLRDAKDALDELLLSSPLEAAQAEARVADAKLTLNDVQEALDGLLVLTPDELAQAEARVADAKLAVRDAQDALDGLVKPTAEQIAQADAVVVGAKLALEDARDALDVLLQPTVRDVAQAQAMVTDAKLALENASTTLEALITGPSVVEIAQTQSQIDLADTSLANARRDLKLTQGDWDGKRSVAADSVEASFGVYRGTIRKWLGTEIDEEEAEQDPATLLDSWGTDLVTLFDSRSRFYDLGRAWLAESSFDDPVTRWNETVLYAWINFYPAPFTSTCDDAGPVGEAACIGREIDDAWDALGDGKDELDTVETQRGKAIANAESVVTRAEGVLADAEEALDDLIARPELLQLERMSNEVALVQIDLDQAEADLAALVNGPDPLDVRARRNKLALAQADLDQAESDLAALINGGDPLEAEAQRKRLAVVQASLDQAKSDLAALVNGSDPLEVQAKRKQVAVALASLGEAEEALAERQGGVDPVEKALREAEVVSAQSALDTAVQRRENAVLRSPWDGLVSVVNVEAGQEVGTNTPVMEVVNPTDVEVDGIVDEIDVLFIREGATASVIMDALPGQVLEGVVSAISTEVRSQQGVVSYPIRIRVQPPAGVQLPEGLSAVASVVIRAERDVLLVPIQALYGTFEEPVVRVKTNGSIEERSVVLGNSDDFWAVVEGGLAEGDLVVMESQQATTGRFGFAGGFGGGFRRFQGAFPGGGGQPPQEPSPVERQQQRERR